MMKIGGGGQSGPGEVTSVRRMKSGAIALHSKHGRNFHTQFALAFWSARGAPPFWIPVTGLGIIGGIGFYKLGAPTVLLLEQLRHSLSTGRYFARRFDVLIGRRDARLPHRQDACATGRSRFSFSDFAIRCVNCFDGSDRWN